MTSEERDLITRFIERASGGQGQLSGQPTGQAPGQPLPPLDPEADRLIADLFARYPEARYRITQMAMVEEHALVEAQNRIARLQWEIQQMRQAQAAPQTDSPWGTAGAAAPQQSRGFLSGLFGGGPARPAAPPPPPQYAPPPPQYPPNYNPGMFQNQGSGFLGSALRTATGVAGGVLAAEALSSLFSGRHEGFGGGWGGGPEQVVEMVPGGNANPWGAPGGDTGDYGGPEKAPMGDDKFTGPAQIDQADWTPAPDQGGGGGWQDAAADPAPDQGGGWDQASDDSSGWSDDSQDT